MDLFLVTSHFIITDSIYLMTRAHTRGSRKIKDFVGEEEGTKRVQLSALAGSENLAQFLLTRRLNLHKSNAANERLADGL